MAPKEAKKRMKTSEHKKHKLLQTTMGPTPRKLDHIEHHQLD